MIEQLQGLGNSGLVPVQGENRPTISVVIPVHRRTKYLHDAISEAVSLLSRHREILVVESGPSEVDVDWLNEYGPGVVTYHHFPDDLGAINNWNRAISLARGHFIHLLHDDDYVKPGFYTAVTEGFCDAPTATGVVCTGYENVDQDGKVTFSSRVADVPGAMYQSWWQQKIGTGNCLQPPCVVVARWVYEKIGLYHPGLAFVPDWEWYMRAACFCQWWNEPRLLARYRVHPESGTKTSTLETKYTTVQAAIDMAQKYYPPFLRDEVKRLSKKHWVEEALSDAIRASRRGDDAATVEAVKWADVLLGHPAANE